MDDKLLGRLGEKEALSYVQRKRKYDIICQNYRSRSGEIDLIAQDGETLVFIEVKTRQSQQYGCPAEAVSPQKQRKIIHAARAYLTQYQRWNQPCRFDVIEVLYRGGKFHIQYIRHAFISTE